MKSIECLVVLWLSIAPAWTFAAQDAAIEAQEGDIEHWIEYYKKERGGSNETVTTESPAPAAEASGAGEGKPDERSDQAPSSGSDNH